MTRAESFVLAVLALVLLVVGCAWLFGPWVLVAAGAGLFVYALLGAQIRE